MNLSSLQFQLDRPTSEPPGFTISTANQCLGCRCSLPCLTFLWVPGPELKSLDLQARSLPTEPPSLPLLYVLYGLVTVIDICLQKFPCVHTFSMDEYFNGTYINGVGEQRFLKEL